MANGETTHPWDLAAQENSEVQLVITNGDGEPSSQGGISPLFTPEVRFWESEIIRWAEEAGLDPNLVASVMQIESCGDPQALSRSGAMGLFQVMEYHFEEGERPYNPETNARRGLAYLVKALAAQNSTRMAFAGYNGGISGAAKPQSQWSSETIRYVYWGTNIYEDALQGEITSKTLDEWLAAGGANLCAQAHQRLGLTP